LTEWLWQKYVTRNFVWLVEPTLGRCSGGAGTRSRTPATVGQLVQFPERHFCGGTILEELRLGHPELGSEQVKQALGEVGLISLHTAPQALSGVSSSVV